MPDNRTLINQVYAAFNQRDVDAVFAHMSDSVSWPKASEGGRVTGKEEIRAYWTRQWQEFDPQVDPIEIVDRAAGKTGVRVHQVVRSLSGELLADGEVLHIYTIANGLIERMDLAETEGDAEHSPSLAFSHH